MTRIVNAVTLAALLGSLSLPLPPSVLAQSVSPLPPASPPAGPAPDQTTASYGDWTLRCNRRVDLTPPRRFCEMALIVQKPGEASAQGQVAVGRVARNEPLKVTAVLPPNLAFKTAPKLVTDGKDAVAIELAWTRCISGACFSDAPLSEETLSKLRSRTEAGRIDYRDGTDREASLPVSFRGFSQALDALAREPD